MLLPRLKASYDSGQLLLAILTKGDLLLRQLENTAFWIDKMDVSSLHQTPVATQWNEVEKMMLAKTNANSNQIHPRKLTNVT